MDIFRPDPIVVIVVQILWCPTIEAADHLDAGLAANKLELECSGGSRAHTGLALSSLARLDIVLL